MPCRRPSARRRGVRAPTVPPELTSAAKRVSPTGLAWTACAAAGALGATAGCRSKCQCWVRPAPALARC
eukprot:3914137-Alexandrium_andersonii.AAC.1